MKKILSITAIALSSLASLLTSCKSEDDLSGTGHVNFKVAINSDVVLNRADDGTLAQNCTIYVYNSENLIRKYHSLDELPSEGLTLVSGDYKVMAWAGDSVAASFTSKYFKGETPFTITKNASVTAEVECKIANVVASVVFDSSVDKVLSDYNVCIANEEGSLDFNASNKDSKGYYMMAKSGEALTYTITGKQLDGSAFTKTGIIEAPKAAHEYKLTVKYDEKSQEVGGALIVVEVDESEIEVKDSHTLALAPRFAAKGFTFSEGITMEPANLSDVTVYATATADLKACTVSGGVLSLMGLPVSSMDLMTVTEAKKTELENLGFSYKYTQDTSAETSQMTMTFSKDLIAKLDLDEYSIEFKATDANGKSKSGTLNLTITNAYVITDDAETKNINAYSATLTGTIVKTDSKDYGISYRKQGTSAWQTVLAETISDTSFSLTLKDLEANTTYEYVANCKGFTAQTKTFTTLQDLQLSNNGFENWYTDSDGAIFPAANEGALFWDSGNKASNTLSVNLTTADSSIKHSGSYSAKLKSQYVSLMGIGKFAAGNIYVGKFLDKDGTNGILGYGRAFKARPYALHGYVKYTPGKVNYTSSDAPACKSGENDKGIIYVALLDETTESYKGNWPMVIRTSSSSRRLFNKDESKVLGYGEISWTEAVGGDELIEFTIPIEYKSMDKVPSNIIVTCAASAYGDYFAGSSNSVMWVDDFELLYK